MKYSNDQFKELEDQFKIADKSKEQLRSKIMKSTYKNKKSHFKKYGWIAAACMLFIVISPFYSTTMASIVEKVLPISITPNVSDGQQNPDLTSKLFKLVEKEGYTVNSVGTTPSPFTIEISLVLKESTLKQAKEDLESKITNYLYENGYDEYELKIIEAPEVPNNERGEDSKKLYDQVREIVKEVFASYGYAEEAEYELAGIKGTDATTIVTIDMPDHIEESKEIIADIEKEIELQNLDVKGIEVDTFNLEHRQQDNRWSFISSDIYDAMAGKSTYQLAGLSYNVKKGHSYVWIKTDLDEPLSQEHIEEIEKAVQEYLALPETKEQIRNDEYTIQFLLKNGESFVEITS
ncbi:DUF4030 domain-containing protein [Rossellomorea yichunensis]|uniref:DUF4030 domain-containing protein n=1 Tax=Rossellomorea yichunensis TaxID=3077331 RepID=UPI0028DFB876|nr:DUF4030 domain-containing protein [Rossellomorea sp. YC4-1]MDT9025051.1 DUF4030 domain-containing protein [Rossellomorea sp. YC4-1]